MKTPVERKIVLGFVASVLALLGMGFLSWRTMTDAFAAQDSVAQTREVIAQLETVLSTLTEAETEQRGYLLTGSGKFLADRRAATQQLPAQLERLAQLTMANPAQQHRVEQLDPLVRQRLDQMDARIAAFQKSGLESSGEQTAMEQGEAVMSDIRSLIGTMRAAEEQQLVARQQDSRASSCRSLAAGAAGGLLAVLVGMAAVWFIRRDLKLRGHAEAEVRSARSLLQSILDNTPALIFLKDADGRYLFVNRRFALIAGRTREEITGKNGFELFDEKLARAAREHDRRILESGRPAEFEEAVSYPDGPHTHLVVKFPVRDAAGKVYAVGGVSSDVSERKRAEQIQEERDRFFDLSRDLICIAGFDGYFKTLNPAWERTLGIPTRELLARPFLEFIHPDDAAASRAEVEKLAAGREIVNFENRFRCADGSWRWFAWNARAAAPQQLIYAAGRDISGQKRADEDIKKLNEDLQRQTTQLAAANKELEAFSYSVSHDLRAPLRHIDGFVGLLARQGAEKLDDRGRRYLDIIADSARRMGALIDDLLVFSRMGRLELRRTAVSLDSLVRETVDDLRTEVNGRRVVWKIGALPEVQADPAMLRQVWANLIGNALKYTRPRDPAEIEIGCAAPENGESVFFIRDNGVGFDMQYAHKLFGVFQRLHRPEEFEGTGIGLANVQRIVSRHGGRVWADGKTGSGATFYFSLPRSKTPSN